MTRRNFPTSVIKARLQHAGCQCEALMADGSRCLVRAERGRFQADHDIPDQMGGEPTFENCRILCLAHHAEKTARDQGDIAKAKRVEARHMGINGKPTQLAGPTREQLNARKATRSRERAPDGRPPVPGYRALFREVGR